MKKIIKISTALILFFTLVSTSNANNDKTKQDISNKMVLEKLELFQSENNTKFELIIQYMTKHFKLIEKRIDQVEKRIDQVDKRIDQVDKRIDQMNQRIDQMNQRIDQMNQRIAQVEKRIDLLEKRVFMIEGRLDQFEYRFEQIDKRFEQVDKRFDFIELLLITLFAATIGTPVILEVRREKKMMKMMKENYDVKKLIETFRELAKKDDTVRDVLKNIDDKSFFYGLN
jgi:chromosome segregation ATPase